MEDDLQRGRPEAPQVAIDHSRPHHQAGGRQVILGYITLVSYERMGMKVEGILLANLAPDASGERLRSLANVPGCWRSSRSAGARG